MLNEPHSSTTTSFLLTLFLCLSSMSLFAQPTFKAGEDPKPTGKIWKLVPHLSDEFSGDVLDVNKWKNTDYARWVGRPPGIFKADAVRLQNDELKFTNYLLSSPETVNGNTYTHGGAYVRSRNKASVGMYVECRMKANKTFMSSTFWLINRSNEASGCDQRTTELDIQECVGQVTTDAAWAQDFDSAMHSNTHSRNVTCDDTPIGSEGNKTSVGGLVYDDYHTYAAWWKSPTEILFFLDGEFKYKVNPVADFDLEMYIQLVSETYDWNPVPSDGGMNGTEAERTTSYQWVRTWCLGAEDGSSDDCGNAAVIQVDEVNCNSLPDALITSTSIPVTVDYIASETRDVVVELWSQSTWLANGKLTVDAGSGIADIMVNLNVAPPAGTDYLLKSSIRPVGTNWQQNIDGCSKLGIRLTDGDNDNLTNTQDLAIQAMEVDIYPNPASKQITLSLLNFEAKKVAIQIINLLGQVQLQKTLYHLSNQLNLDVSTLQNGIYYLTIKMGHSKVITKKVMVS